MTDLALMPLQLIYKVKIKNISQFNHFDGMSMLHESHVTKRLSRFAYVIQKIVIPKGVKNNTLSESFIRKLTE